MAQPSSSSSSTRGPRKSRTGILRPSSRTSAVSLRSTAEPYQPSPRPAWEARDAGRRYVGAVLEGFHPLVARWFEARFETPTEPQEAGWPAIQAGRDTLISAPTGSGKTLAAFLACLDGLVRQGLDGALRDETAVLYVSPLKALGNDIEKNLAEPLAELCAAAAAEGLALPPVRVMVRSGDTPSARRQAMLRHPPHVLVTTPESFYLLLTSGRGRELLRTVRTVVCDEIHAVARDKRGAHLALSLERLEALTVERPQRIGLSATQRPIEEVARFRPRRGDPPGRALGSRLEGAVGRDLRPGGGARAGAPHHPRLREHPAARRARRARARGAARSRRGGGAPRQPGARPPDRRRGAPEGRAAPLRGGDRLAGARHRRRLGGAGGAAGLARGDRDRRAAG